MDKGSLGFTGTQHRWSAEQLARLVSVLSAIRDAGVEWMLNGDCLGSDARAGKLWTGWGGKLRLYPPDNPSKRAFLFASETMPEAPYLKRNHHIVRDCAALIATPQEDFEQLRSGTWATIRYARKLRRPICIVWPGQPATVENWKGGWGAPFATQPNPPASTRAMQSMVLSDGTPTVTRALCTEAADHIEALTAERDAAVKAITDAIDTLGDCELNLNNCATFGCFPGTVEYQRNCVIAALDTLHAALSPPLKDMGEPL